MVDLSAGAYMTRVLIEALGAQLSSCLGADATLIQAHSLPDELHIQDHERMVASAGLPVHAASASSCNLSSLQLSGTLQEAAQAAKEACLLASCPRQCALGRCHLKSPFVFADEVFGAAVCAGGA